MYIYTKFHSILRKEDVVHKFLNHDSYQRQTERERERERERGRQSAVWRVIIMNEAAVWSHAQKGDAADGHS